MIFDVENSVPTFTNDHTLSDPAYEISLNCPTHIVYIATVDFIIYKYSTNEPKVLNDYKSYKTASNDRFF